MNANWPHSAACVASQPNLANYRELRHQSHIGLFKSLNISLVINQFNEHKSLRKTTVVVSSVLDVKINSVKASTARGRDMFLLP
jgi:hypothetical protein